MKKILLVEDDVLVARLLTRGLERAGLRVEHVHTGSEAVQRLKDGSYDVAIVDVGLPDLDGGDVAQLLRRHEQEHGRERCIVIVSSARDLGQDDPVRAIADAVVPKPLSARRVLEILSVTDAASPGAS